MKNKLYNEREIYNIKFRGGSEALVVKTKTSASEQILDMIISQGKDYVDDKILTNIEQMVSTFLRNSPSVSEKVLICVKELLSRSFKDFQSSADFIKNLISFAIIKSEIDKTGNTTQKTDDMSIIQSWAYSRTESFFKGSGIDLNDVSKGYKWAIDYLRNAQNSVQMLTESESLLKNPSEMVISGSHAPGKNILFFSQIMSTNDQSYLFYFLYKLFLKAIISWNPDFYKEFNQKTYFIPKNAFFSLNNLPDNADINNYIEICRTLASDIIINLQFDGTNIEFKFLSESSSSSKVNSEYLHFIRRIRKFVDEELRQSERMKEMNEFHICNSYEAVEIKKGIIIFKEETKIRIKSNTYFYETDVYKNLQKKILNTQEGRDYLMQKGIPPKKQFNLLFYGPPGTGKTENVKSVILKKQCTSYLRFPRNFVIPTAEIFINFYNSNTISIYDSIDETIIEIPIDKNSRLINFIGFDLNNFIALADGEIKKSWLSAKNTPLEKKIEDIEKEIHRLNTDDTKEDAQTTSSALGGSATDGPVEEEKKEANPKEEEEEKTQDPLKIFKDEKNKERDELIKQLKENILATNDDGIKDLLAGGESKGGILILETTDTNIKESMNNELTRRGRFELFKYDYLGIEEIKNLIENFYEIKIQENDTTTGADDEEGKSESPPLLEGTHNITHLWITFKELFKTKSYKINLNEINSAFMQSIPSDLTTSCGKMLTTIISKMSI